MSVRLSLVLLAVVALAGATGCAGIERGVAPPLPDALGTRTGNAFSLAPDNGPHFVRYLPVNGRDGDLFDVIVGPDRALWFTEVDSGAIGRMDAKGHVMTFPVPSSAGVPVAITAGGDGNLWFTLGGGSQQGIGRITPAGVVTTFAFGVAFGTELDITKGPDGNVWFTDFSSNKIGKATPDGTITEFPAPDIGAPLGITLGPDRKLWICEEGALQGNRNVPGRIMSMTTAGKFTSYTLTPQDWTTAPQFITPGHDGKLWFTETDGSASPYNVESITRLGAIAKFALPAGSEPPFHISRGADKNVWFSETETYLVRVTPNGTITPFTMPQPPGTSLPAQPRGIVSGPNQNLWWIETSSGSLGVFNPR